MYICILLAREVSDIIRDVKERMVNLDMSVTLDEIRDSEEAKSNLLINIIVALCIYV